ncbi:hypothetical protein C4568_00305 [Candidatus Parcubacteria bacterium]|nr:MAG: hypothetical protein C4568_00305 [Candidatus Parcubacteria bacterium]
MEGGEFLAKNAATYIAEWSGKERSYVQNILIANMHFDRTVIFSLIALAYSGVFDWPGKFRHIRRTAYALVIGHAVLAYFWIWHGDATLWWYEGHERWIKKILRDNAWHHAETLARTIKLHGVIVFAETLAVATLVVRVFYLGGRWYIRWLFKPPPHVV